MATWHQMKGMRAGRVASPYAPEAKSYKVVQDPPGGMASAILFKTLEEAQAYQDKRGGVLVKPRAEA